jgi:hypothetical protein
LLEENGVVIESYQTGKPGRPRKPKIEPLPSLKYAIVDKHREKGKVVDIKTKIVYGDEEEIREYLATSPVSNSVNIAFVERNNLTIRQTNKRLERKSLGFSKESEEFDNQLILTLGNYHFCKPHGGLKVKNHGGLRKWTHRTPAMAAGKTNHIWTLSELVTYKISPNLRC